MSHETRDMIVAWCWLSGGTAVLLWACFAVPYWWRLRTPRRFWLCAWLWITALVVLDVARLRLASGLLNDQMLQTWPLVASRVWWATATVLAFLTWLRPERPGRGRGGLGV